MNPWKINQLHIRETTFLHHKIQGLIRKPFSPRTNNLCSRMINHLTNTAFVNQSLLHILILKQELRIRAGMILQSNDKGNPGDIPSRGRPIPPTRESRTLDLPEK
ncbi:hypothetical protein Droror1_Dr00003381 [Drosera rotundifolia]